MTWHSSPMFGLDTETTGVDVETDRIVQSAVVAVIPSKGAADVDARIINPGIHIPDAAARIHGITTDRAKAEGADPAATFEHVAAELTEALTIGYPIVGMNVCFDLTLLDRECRRHGVATIEQRLRLPLAPVIDVMVLDKHAHPYRRGGRKLVDLCGHYGVTLGADAHDAGADALAACRVAWRIGQWGSNLPDSHFRDHPGISARDAGEVMRAYRRLAGLSLVQMHELQIKAKREQDTSFARYLRKQAASEQDAAKRADLLGRAEECRGHWPLAPFAGPTRMAAS